jgi:hypothetical protein
MVAWQHPGTTCGLGKGTLCLFTVHRGQNLLCQPLVAWSLTNPERTHGVSIKGIVVSSLGNDVGLGKGQGMVVWQHPGTKWGLGKALCLFTVHRGQFTRPTSCCLVAHQS